MGASEGTAVKRYQVDKMWNSASTKFTGVILSRVAGDTETVTITRVDRGVYWILDPKKKIYEEKPIEPISKQEGDREPREKEKPKVRVTKSELSVKKTGASETIHGFPCEEYLVTWLLEMEEIETKAKSQSTMTMNLWTTPETAAIRKVQTEEREFHKAYAQKIGYQNLSRRSQPDGHGRYGIHVRRFAGGNRKRDGESKGRNGQDPGLPDPDGGALGHGQ